MESCKGYCFLRAVPVRREPSDRSEMVNQLLLGDTFEVLEQQEKWSRIRGDYDGYEGWIDNKQWKADDGEWRNYGIMESGNQGIRELGNQGIMGLRDLEIAESASPSAVARELYLDAPYLWGGRTVMGIDCSGLTQVCFKACGIRLLRDASQQATQGIEVPSLAEARCDDLCFFSNADGRIIHVGICLGNGRIIHASGQVRIDRLDATGIYNEDRQCYTHKLCAIRRVV